MMGQEKGWLTTFETGNTMKAAISFVKNILFDGLTFLLNLFIWRDKKVWLFGSWMGQKFADNPRFLFQYLSEHKDEYQIKKVIWVTRNPSVYATLREMGYTVFKMHSVQSYYYHLKAGVHLLCNNCASVVYPHDILSELSFGAKKVQLWHGIGIKACSRLIRRGEPTLREKLLDTVFNPYCQPGMWGNCYFFSPSEENKRVIMADFGVKEDRFITAAYPRLCGVSRLLASEQEVIDRVVALKKTHKIIFFLPTFRQDMSDYIRPQDIEGFDAFLEANSYVWVQKNHSVDTNLDLSEQHNNVMVLPSDFDVNVLYEYIDLLITDYSSASSDAIYMDKMTLEYCPDYAYYSQQDRGFVSDFGNYHIGNLVQSPDALFDAIQHCIEIDPKTLERHRKTKEFLFGTHPADMRDVTTKIKEKLKV